ncbi:hypothetical protein [Bacillus marinisedimentorum]|uniref:hypothetical protein n=1 Tax=Bacillus marinisedimentorum TaxID=1821260 RepID=UPI0008725EB1|nr:hypothetical protein [Bacillus marinisedimentorum]
MNRAAYGVNQVAWRETGLVSREYWLAWHESITVWREFKQLRRESSKWKQTKLTRCMKIGLF